jgi:methionine-rich copper-binding protein CopC
MHRFSVALVAAALTVLPVSAFAHAHLRTAIPAAGSTDVAPTEITCVFTEALEPKFSALEVQDAAGKRVDAGNMHLAADNPKRMILGVLRLAPGVYTVIWRATSVDTHRTEGKYSFTVVP